jgi:putative exosortase-associated protein (TIGR04073 family)
MKNRIILLLVGAFCVGSLAFGDIQSSPGSHWNWSRKLSRAVANLAYGVPAEYLVHWQRMERAEGVNMAASAMVVEGTSRSVVRLGYGLFELVTFPFPCYKGTYRPPYHKNDRFDPWGGYEEFPPQVGFTSQARYGRTQSW